MNTTKSFKIEIDCANCANLVEEKVKKIAGVKDLSISYMTQKMKITFMENADQQAVLNEVIMTAKKIEPEFAIL